MRVATGSTRHVTFVAALVMATCLTWSASAWAITRTMQVAGGGVLTAAETFSTAQCGPGKSGLDHITKLTSFAYSLDTVSQPNLAAIFHSAPDCDDNPKYTLPLRSGCTIKFDSQLAPAITCGDVPGYVGPKYLVVGVSYAAPGPGSFVQYSTSSSFGTTTSLSSSFSSNTSISVSLSHGVSIAGVLKGDVKVTGTVSASQTSTTSSSTTVSIENLFTTLLPGTPDAFSPINHDYDIIWLWLNPVMLFTVRLSPPSFPSAVTWNGYAYDLADQPGMDIWPIEVGYLNGHFGPLPPTHVTVLSRSWAATQVYPPGHGPELTSEDFANILRSDPFTTAGYSVTLSPSANPVTSSDGRFTIAGVTNGSAQSFVYRQPAPGGSPLTQSFTNTYTTMSTLGRSSAYQEQVEFGIDVSLSGSFFAKFSSTLNISQTFTHTHEASSSVTSTGTVIDSLSITGPPCGSNTPPCSPVYTGPSEFDVYQDNIFGSFMFNPVR